MLDCQIRGVGGVVNCWSNFMVACCLSECSVESLVITVTMCESGGFVGKESNRLNIVCWESMLEETDLCIFKIFSEYLRLLPSR